MVHHLRHLATRVTIASVLNWQVQLMNVNLDGTVPWEPQIRNQLITLLVIFAPKAATVLEEVMHQNDALLVLFSTQLETGIVNTYSKHDRLNRCDLVSLLFRRDRNATSKTGRFPVCLPKRLFSYLHVSRTLSYTYVKHFQIMPI